MRYPQQALPDGSPDPGHDEEPGERHEGPEGRLEPETASMREAQTAPA